MATNKTKNGTGITLDKMIQPTLLLLIYQKPAHGYELIQNFKAMDPTEVVEPGTIYRYLRRMESEGFIKSKWETSEAGPARRQYEITMLGFKALKEAVIKLEHQKRQIEDFLITFKEMEERGNFSEN
ncbi:PadR family transcriptional regulator [Desulfoscipio geothermicus]|uniref:Transcriptional regulator PadR-like family protein n=1 Tax=Desulfoscipio geothermicus DSM 3669 TaxID=1121426 RepID=A0A1I6EI93_9FIRM|nr:helix-turn-helix transcriptional regulator [Desulfoscipio geothermicus]SFR17474.1 Transcriptional regulator PadR-like family protein [Desulfoscipio geothermicus DSM 3669]